MAAQNYVSGDGWISDESSFYGDEDEKSRLESAVAGTSPEVFWSAQAKLPSSIAFEATNSTPEPGDAKDESRLYLSYDGNMEFRQSNESTDDFLNRLPPSTTRASPPSGTTKHNADEDGDFWIRVHNPHISDNPLRNERKAEFIREGNQALQDFESDRAKLEVDNPDKAKGVITRKMKPRKEQLERDLSALMYKHHVKSGKWMLFVPVGDVDRVWRLVVDAVWDNQLGTEAKVAPAEEEKDLYEGARLICVYTKDFDDMKDVKRVLEALSRLRLFDVNGRGIYYKTDGYTHLKIYRDNKYGLKASLYWSQDIVQGKTL